MNPIRVKLFMASMLLALAPLTVAQNDSRSPPDTAGGSTDAKEWHRLGEMHLYGKGAPEDPVKALELLRRAADAGYVPAATSLGTLYMFGAGHGVIPADRQKAIEWYEKAGEKNDPAAQQALGFIYSTDDPKKSFDWYRRAAEHGMSMPQFQVADAYRRGHGVARDNRAAVEWLQKSAAQGWPDAIYWLGLYYFGGVVVPKDEAKAVELFSLAAKRGSPGGMTAYGVRLMRGEGVQKDVKQGSTLIWNAARRGYGKAQAWVGSFYERGTGVNKDPVLALAWYAIAVRKGEEAAGKKVAEIEAQLTPEEVAEARRLANDWHSGDIKRKAP